MIWPDSMIQERFTELVPNANERDYSLINPASFDVRIGYEYKVQESPGRKDVYDEFPDHKAWSRVYSLEKDEVYWMKPGEMVLVRMLERVHVSQDYCMQFKLKSSRGREGFDHADAGWIDPGWDGYLTMELSNNLLYRKIGITPGLRIGQLVVMQMLEPCLTLYSGRYNGATIVEESKPKFSDVKI